MYYHMTDEEFPQYLNNAIEEERKESNNGGPFYFLLMIVGVLVGLFGSPIFSLVGFAVAFICVIPAAYKKSKWENAQRAKSAAVKRWESENV